MSERNSKSSWYYFEYSFLRRVANAACLIGYTQITDNLSDYLSNILQLVKSSFLVIHWRKLTEQPFQLACVNRCTQSNEVSCSSRQANRWGKWGSLPVVLVPRDWQWVRQCNSNTRRVESSSRIMVAKPARLVVSSLDRCASGWCLFEDLACPNLILWNNFYVVTSHLVMMELVLDLMKLIISKADITLSGFDVKIIYFWGSPFSTTPPWEAKPKASYIFSKASRLWSAVKLPLAHGSFSVGMLCNFSPPPAG